MLINLLTLLNHVKTLVHVLGLRTYQQIILSKKVMIRIMELSVIPGIQKKIIANLMENIMVRIGAQIHILGAM